MDNNAKRKFYSRALAMLMMVSLSSCGSSEENCEIKEEHAHMYVTESGLKKPFICEEYRIGYDFKGFSFSGAYKTEEYITLSLDNKDEITNMPSRLFRISDNLEYIINLESQFQDYYEYKYTYSYSQMVSTSRYGKVYAPRHIEDWGDDPAQLGATGESRLCHHVYRGYKIIIDDKGEIEVIESPWVDSYKDLDPEYMYITNDYGKKIEYTYLDKENSLKR